MREITSISNNIVKYVRDLKDKTFRYSSLEFIVEGANIIKDLPYDVEVLKLFVEKSKLNQFEDIIQNFKCEKYVVDEKVMKAISDTSTPCGLLCTVKIKEQKFVKGNNVVVLDGVSDPGNMGTIIRTCVACGIKDIFAINCVDFLSPKVVRSSMGGIFRVNAINSNYDDVFQKLVDYNFLTMDMNGKNIYEIDKVERPFALVVGSEAHGVSKIMKDKCNTLISLPMVGDIESLNAAISLSVALYHLSFSKILK